MIWPVEKMFCNDLLLLIYILERKGSQDPDTANTKYLGFAEVLVGIRLSKVSGRGPNNFVHCTYTTTSLF
uniref:Uncharacterized protein n=1 Tax=Arundo donax TaxID=35708 RepID=A0A0A9E183_ARUDO